MPKETVPEKIPIEQAVKNVLLEKKQTPPWLGNMFADVCLELAGEYPQKPIEEKKVYETLWGFSKMTPEEISELDKNKLASMLAMLETEDQDDLVRRLSKNFEKDFWDLADK